MTLQFENLNTIQTMTCIVVQSLFFCVADVCADGLMVANVKSEKEEEAGKLQTKVWTTRALGGIIATYSGTKFNAAFGTKAVFAASSVLPLVAAGVIWWAPEARAVAAEVLPFKQRLQSTMAGVWNTLKHARYLVVFCFVFAATPSFSSALFVFLTTKLKYSMTQLADLDILGSFCGVFGTVLFYSCVKRVNPKYSILAGLILQAVVRSSLIYVVTDPNWALTHKISQIILYLENCMMSLLGNFTQMPLLLVAAHACKAPYEASCYATILSVSNFGGASSAFLGGAITKYLQVSAEDWTSLPSLIKVCIISTGIPALALFLLPLNFDVGKKNTAEYITVDARDSAEEIVEGDFECEI
jgi:hypothetical protein